MTVTPNQQQFLATIHNESHFISMLGEKLSTENIAVEQIQIYADVLIIETAIDEKLKEINTTVLIGDLLIILTAWTPID